MQIPVLKRFLTEDFPNAPSWFGRFLSTLNTFMEQVIQIFNKNITFGENIQSSYFVTQFITDTSYATGVFTPIKFQWRGSLLPYTCITAQISRADRTPILDSVGTLDWVYGNGSINIRYISGLQAGVKYNVSFLAF